MIRLMSLMHSYCLVIFLIQNVVLEETQEAEEDDIEHQIIESQEEEKIPALFHWQRGIVPYFIDTDHYDKIISKRIRSAMNMIESSSCVIFRDIGSKPPPGEEPGYLWLSIENPDGVRECSHTTLKGDGALAIMILGFDCIQRRDILHSLMHVLGFNDEVTHPQRDTYIRIMWPNIHPRYRSLFWMRPNSAPLLSMVEYDTMSVMHFHDRAYSINGGATIAPLIPGLLINPSDKLSQLDIMKLRLAFGHECNKRKVGHLFQTCHNALKDEDGDGGQDSDDEESPEIVPIVRTDQTTRRVSVATELTTNK